MQFSGEGGRLRPGQLQETIPTSVNKTGLWRFLTPVHREKLSPCRLLCPLENGIALWMNEVREGDWQKAWQIMQEYNPFPALTGFICYRFCQEKCHRGLWDEPVAIAAVEKAIGLWRHQNYRSDKIGGQSSSDREQRGKKRVAIIGSGPAGLSCAYYLQQRGVAVTVFEKLPLAGGLLATGVPEYRLPRRILRKELQILEAEGIVFKTNREVGRDIDLPELQDDFDAVLFAVGAQQSRPLRIAGEGLPGVTGALEFLRDIHLGRPREMGRRVIVVGGGNTAVDAACMAKLLGAREVNLLYRRSEGEMPAYPEEIKVAGAAGVKFVFETIVQEIFGTGRVQKVRAQRVAPSRRGERLQVLSHTLYDLQCDLLIVAAGQESGPGELASTLQFPPLKEKGYGFLEGPPGKEKIVLMAGEALTGPATIAHAIFSGRKAALLLLQALKIYPKGEDIPGIAAPLPGDEKALSFDLLNPALYRRQSRQTAAQQEAERCFSCGTCSNCGVCWVFCPDLAIEERDGAFHILLDYCKGCGVCVEECPAGVLTLEEVDSNGT